MWKLLEDQNQADGVFCNVEYLLCAKHCARLSLSIPSLILSAILGGKDCNLMLLVRKHTQRSHNWKWWK